MKGKLLQNLSANTVQLVVNQAFGLLIFFVLSNGLDKTTFGKINLVLAVLLAVFNILSFGIDQVVVRKIASGSNARSLLSVYLFHVVVSGWCFYMLLIFGRCFAPHWLGFNNLLLLIAIGKAMVFFSTPFKQVAAGLEQFKLLSRMSVISNIIRGCALLVLSLIHSLTINYVVVVFIIGDVAELLIAIFLFKACFKIPIAISKKGYMQLIKESFPQMGVVVFTSALARFDWIFIGAFVSAIKLAEYSFAYKIFELSSLPLLAIAPLLVPRFAAIITEGRLPVANLQKLLRLEMVIAALTALLLYLCWSPLMDGITAGKYGAVNAKTILILAACMPLLYFNNFLWSIAFAQGRLKMILGVIALTFIVNVLGDVILIPLFKNEGAALGYLFAMLAQCLAYIKNNNVQAIAKGWVPLLICSFCAVVAGVSASLLFHNIYLMVLFGLFIYTVFIVITRQLGLSDVKTPLVF
jgi:O-antigen/teichoic acid export membrane protein